MIPFAESEQPLEVEIEHINQVNRDSLLFEKLLHLLCQRGFEGVVLHDFHP